MNENVIMRHERVINPIKQRLSRNSHECYIPSDTRTQGILLKSHKKFCSCQVLSNNNRNSGSLTQNGHQRQDNNNSLPTISSSLEHHPKLDKEYSPSKDSGIQISGSSSGKGSVESVDDSRQLPNLQRKPSLTSLESRGQWGSKWEFLLSCVGLSVGIGNVSNFCVKHCNVTSGSTGLEISVSGI